jgi:DNA-binding LacI/PurR family transcriptional regulator
MATPEHPRMSDVAQRAGVSLSTVSRALRGAAGVAPVVRQRVEAAAAELDYVVSRGASGLVTGRTGRIAVIVPFLRPWFFGVALAGVHERLRETGTDMVVYETGDTAALDRHVRGLPLRRNVDAVIAVSLDLDAQELGRFEELGLPVVFCSQQVPDLPSVYIDDEGAARTATRYLLNLGHRRIAYVQPHDETGFSWSSRLRLNGYRAAMAGAGLPPTVVTTAPGPAGGEAAIGELMAASEPPTAVFTESDDMAYGVLRALRRAGVAVPGAVSVVGFDDQDHAGLFDLTTVAQPVRRLGYEAARLATALVLGEDTEHGAGPSQLELPTRLVLRSSVAAPRAAVGLAPSG